MITEDYISFETAKLLKEKGFDIPSFNPEEWPCCMYDEEGKLQWGCYSDKWYCRITLQMATKWLREVHNLHIQPEITIWPRKGYFFRIYSYSSRHIDFLPFVRFSDSYEEACEAAIRYCLENLI